MATRQERLNALADHLENKVTDEHFNMYSYVSSKDIYGKIRDEFLQLAEFKCGSTGCIAGWTLALFAIDKLTNDRAYFDIAKRCLGLTTNEAFNLFHDYELTRLSAVKELRKLALINPNTQTVE